MAKLVLLFPARDKYGISRDDDYGDRDELRPWMIGYFEGYNGRAGARVTLDIRPDGRVSATVNGIPIRGRVRDGVMTAGGASYTLERTRDGLQTRQIGCPDNVVRYRRR